jgi:hypothetical protein
MKGGKVEDWKRLDEVWGLVGDKPAFTKYVRSEIEQMLVTEKEPMPTSQKTEATTQTPNAQIFSAKEAPVIPIPSAEKTSTDETSTIPLP